MAKLFTIDVSPLKAKLRAIGSVAAARMAARSGANAAVQQVGLAFRTEGAHYGAKWAPRKASTVKALSARRRKKNGKLGKARTPKPILRDTGTLKKSFFVADGGGDSFAVATPVRYAKYHESGTSKMPARPVMPFDKDGNPRSSAVERAVRRAMEARIQSLLGR
ncbi:MAG: phage virion morphogenesis protein [Kiritimatiellae bacterium]|nr:phage virion morphogenesis protein [Kiritimatiellia bacterium]